MATAPSLGPILPSGRRLASAPVARRNTARSGEGAIRKTIGWAAAASVLVALGTAVGFFRPDRALQVAVGATAHNLCSTAFISGQPADATFRELVATLIGPPAKFIGYTVDPETRSVQARIGLLVHASARFTPGYGCRLVSPSNTPLPALTPKAPMAAQPADDGFAPPDVVAPADASLKAAVDRVFADRAGEKPKFVKAVVVVKNNRVIAERYAAGFGVGTEVLSYSVAKSFTNALLAVLVRQGKLRVDQPPGRAGVEPARRSARGPHHRAAAAYGKWVSRGGDRVRVSIRSRACSTLSPIWRASRLATR